MIISFRYFREMWNWYEISMILMFMLTFLFWVISLMDEEDKTNVDLERKYWHHLDPILLSEGTFAVATIMAFFKLMFLCQLNYHLGPLQVYLKISFFIIS